MSRQRADQLGIPYKLIFRGFQVAGCDPDEMGIGPVYAVPKLLQRTGVKFNDIDLWELNEAFAVQVVYCRDRLGIDPEKLNVNGGSVSIGHPFGMTGWRMVGTLANEMARRKARYGGGTMCGGGGQGAAGVVERAKWGRGTGGIVRACELRMSYGPASRIDCKTRASEMGNVTGRACVDLILRIAVVHRQSN